MQSVAFPGVNIFIFEVLWIYLYDFYVEDFDMLSDFWIPEFDEQETLFYSWDDDFLPFDAYFNFSFESYV